VAEADGELQPIEPPFRILIFNIKQTLVSVDMLKPSGFHPIMVSSPWKRGLVLACA